MYLSLPPRQSLISADDAAAPARSSGRCARATRRGESGGRGPSRGGNPRLAARLAPRVGLFSARLAAGESGERRLAVRVGQKKARLGRRKARLGAKKTRVGSKKTRVGDFLTRVGVF